MLEKRRQTEKVTAIQRYEGSVFSGLGRAQTRVADNVFLYERKVGVRFFPGTLNLRLTTDFTIPPTGVHIDASEITTSGRRTGITLVPAKIAGQVVFLMCPDLAAYEPNVVEVLAAFNIRERFNLKDGDKVLLEV